MNKKDYFSDDCIVEDILFTSLKDLLICPLCKKIFNEPYMCSKCQNVYCKECLRNFSNFKSCPNKDNCKSNKFVKSINKNELISKIKYKCKNCSEEVMRCNINSHLESDCEPKLQQSQTLLEQYQTKKRLVKLSSKEMGEIDKSKINHFTSK